MSFIEKKAEFKENKEFCDKINLYANKAYSNLESALCILSDNENIENKIKRVGEALIELKSIKDNIKDEIQKHKKLLSEYYNDNSNHNPEILEEAKELERYALSFDYKSLKKLLSILEKKIKEVEKDIVNIKESSSSVKLVTLYLSVSFSKKYLDSLLRAIETDKYPATITESEHYIEELDFAIKLLNYKYNECDQWVVEAKKESDPIRKAELYDIASAKIPSKDYLRFVSLLLDSSEHYNSGNVDKATIGQKKNELTGILTMLQSLKEYCNAKYSPELVDEIQKELDNLNREVSKFQKMSVAICSEKGSDSAGFDELDIRQLRERAERINVKCKRLKPLVMSVAKDKKCPVYDEYTSLVRNFVELAGEVGIEINSEFPHTALIQRFDKINQEVLNLSNGAATITPTIDGVIYRYKLIKSYQQEITSIEESIEFLLALDPNKDVCNYKPKVQYIKEELGKKAEELSKFVDQKKQELIAKEENIDKHVMLVLMYPKLSGVKDLVSCNLSIDKESEIAKILKDNWLNKSGGVSDFHDLIDDYICKHDRRFMTYERADILSNKIKEENLVAEVGQFCLEAAGEISKALELRVMRWNPSTNLAGGAAAGVGGGIVSGAIGYGAASILGARAVFTIGTAVTSGTLGAAFFAAAGFYIIYKNSPGKIWDNLKYDCAKLAGNKSARIELAKKIQDESPESKYLVNYCIEGIGPVLTEIFNLCDRIYKEEIFKEQVALSSVLKKNVIYKLLHPDERAFEEFITGCYKDPNRRALCSDLTSLRSLMTAISNGEEFPVISDKSYGKDGRRIFDEAMVFLNNKIKANNNKSNPFCVNFYYLFASVTKACLTESCIKNIELTVKNKETIKNLRRHMYDIIAIDNIETRQKELSIGGFNAR